MSGTALVTSLVAISFGNADLFTSATLTATAGPNTSTATVNPVTKGDSPEHPNNTTFVLQPPLVVPAGQTATFRLAATVTGNPQISKRGEQVMYAAMLGGGSNGATIFLVALALLELCAAAIGSIRRRWLLIALLPLLALVSQAGCNNGSASLGVVSFMQTATQLNAMSTAKNDPPVIVGLPVTMGTVSVAVK
jgi:hypothetical protein